MPTCRNSLSIRAALLLCALLPLFAPMPSHAQSSTSYKTLTTRWRADDDAFASWSRDGVALALGGALRLDGPRSTLDQDPYSAGAYKGGNYYNGGSFYRGYAVGPVVTAGFGFSEAVPSWNATTPSGTWLEIELRVRIAESWTDWYSMGVWSSASGQGVSRHSVSEQVGAAAYVDVDTLKVGTRSASAYAQAYQMRLHMFTANRAALPRVQSAAVVVSNKPASVTASAGNPSLWGKTLQVPECSQMIYPGGGEVWCSPTSVAMVLGYWAGHAGACSTDVHAAVAGVYDRIYDGHGNWPFNTAYAAGGGMEAVVSRFTSLAQAEPWIAAGVPVVMSVSWKRGELTGAPIPSSAGHLMVLVGFDASGNPIVNDPAAPGDNSVQRIYKRAELEQLWLQASGGTVYLIYPQGRDVPGLQ